LRASAEGTKNSGLPLGSLTPRDALTQVMDLALDAVAKLQKVQEKDKLSTGGAAAESKPVIINTRLHCEAFEAISAVCSNRYMVSMI
jgi:hypothetical protein